MAISLPFLSPRIPLKTAATVCKSLSTMLHAGVPLLKALDVVSRKTGDSTCRRKLTQVRDLVQTGTEISEALREQGGYFPPLLADMISIGENTGSLPEILDGLSDHYENLLRLRRSFLGTIAMPVIQLVAAIFIIALMILVLGMIAASGGNKPIDVLGFGLYGPAGATKFLSITFGSIFVVLIVYYLLAESFHQKRLLDSVLLKIPVIGTCMRSFAIARFSWALGLTQQTGMSMLRSIDFSLKATGNGAFAGASDEIRHWVQEGDELTEALANSHLFTDEYLQVVQVAEASGTIPETMQRLSPQFEDQARRGLSMLATAMGVLVWVFVAGCIIFVIFRIAFWYVGLINDAVNNPMG
ncbi:MAG: type II secretion system F family protein [Planctomycetota bacterium]|nr:type II secretion system F family protein [Planctomycetota bacterium]